MIKTVKVISIDAGAMHVMPLQEERCGACEGGNRCLAAQPKTFCVAYDARRKVGDEFSLSTNDAYLRHKMMLLYGLPLLGLLAGALSLASWGDAASAFGALLGVCLAGTIVRITHSENAQICYTKTDC